MTERPTATIVLDGFLAAWGAASSLPDEDRVVVAWLREFLETLGLEPIDDLTAYLLSHSTGRLPTDRELGAALTVVEVIPEFFTGWLSRVVGAKPEQMHNAARVVSLLGCWLLARRLVDQDVCEHVTHLTSVYDEEGWTEGRVSPGRG